MDSKHYILTVSDLIAYALTDLLNDESLNTIDFQTENEDIDLRYTLDILHIYHSIVYSIGIEDKVVKLYYYGLKDNRIYALFSDGTQIEIGYTQDTLATMAKETKSYLHDAMMLYEKISHVHVHELLLEESHKFYGMKDDTKTRFAEPAQNSTESDQWKLLEILFKSIHKDKIHTSIHTKHHDELSLDKRISEDFFHLALSWMKKETIKKSKISYISVELNIDNGYEVYIIDKNGIKTFVDIDELDDENDKERLNEIENLLSPEFKNKDFIKEFLESESKKYFSGEKTEFESIQGNKKEDTDKSFERMKQNLEAFFDGVEEK